MTKQIGAHGWHPRAARLLPLGALSFTLALGASLLALPAAAAPAPKKVPDSLARGFCARAPSNAAASRPIAANDSPADQAAAANSGEAYLVKDINLSGDSYSDGTAAGTVPATDIGCSYPYDLTEFNSSLLFNLDDGVHGRELWRIAP